RERAYRDIRERIAPKFDRLARRLRRALGSAPARDATLPPLLASLIAQLLEEQGSDLEQRLALIRSPASHAEAHAARIRLKRARYLLEPVVHEAAPAASVLKRLKQVQQLLGDLHDLQVVIVRLGDAAAEAAAERTRRLHELAVGGDRAAARGPRPATSGLLALARVARATQERLFRRLVNRRVARTLPAELTALAAELRPPAGPVAPPIAAWPSRAPARPTGDNSLRYRLKYAYATYTPTGSDLTFKLGLIHTPWLDWEEALWDYRMQGQMAFERAGYGSAADFGAGVDGKWGPDKVNMQVTLVNGEGYSGGGGDQRKDVMGRVSVRVLDTDDSSRVGGLRITAYGQYGKPTGGGERQRLLGMVSYRTKHLTLAGEALVARDSVTAPVTVEQNGHLF